MSKDNNKETTTSKAEKKKIRFGIRLKLAMSIITMVALIIFTIAAFILHRESGILRSETINFSKRELVHLANTVQQTIGYDELTLSDAVRELKNLNFFKYGFVLNKDNDILYYFDNRKGKEYEHTPRKKLQDLVERNLGERKDSAQIVISEYEDKKTDDNILDFSKYVLSRLDNKTKVGVVILGISDEVIREKISELTYFLGLIFLGFLVFSIILTLVVAAIIVRPIKQLTQGASIIGGGDFSHRIDVSTRDELGELADEFNLMTQMIQDAKEKEIEARIMDEQLEMAKDIQEGLNPMTFYDKNGIEIKGFTRAAKGVGGDYFDYLDIDEDRVCALISDVSGKGVPASLVMVMIRTVFTSYITREDVDCARVVRAINDSLSADFAIDKFATLFFIIYNRKTEELSFSNAGHGPLFCYRQSRGVCTRTSLDGVPIGIMEEVEYPQARIKLEPGDMIVMYTDGITEMRNPEKEEYGLVRLQNLMIENHDLNADEFIAKVVSDVDEFRGEAAPHDDMTVMAFKRDR